MTSKPRLIIQVKRAYDAPDRSDGTRILVDRIWPRGISKDKAALNGWHKDISPSTELRKWFAHEVSRWAGFRARYFAELAARPEAIDGLLEACAGHTLTLVFGAKDVAHNNAVALKEYLERHSLRKHR